MRNSLPLLLLHHLDPKFLPLFEHAARGRFTLRTLPDWDVLLREAHTSPPTTLAVVDPYAGQPDTSSLAPQLCDLLRDSPGVGVVAALLPAPGRPEHLRTLGEWGVSEVLLLERLGAPAALLATLASARGRSLQRLVRRVVPSSLPGAARRILLAAAQAVAAGGHSSDLARALCVCEMTVTRRCHRLHLPPPRRLLAWVRVLLAAELLDGGGRSLQGVAYACGYAAESGLRGALRELLGATATELRRRGAFEAASRAFTRELLGREGAEGH